LKSGSTSGGGSGRGVVAQIPKTPEGEKKGFGFMDEDEDDLEYTK
jgi:hypothetical protein